MRATGMTVALATVWLAAGARGFAAESATASITDQDLGGGNFDYTITLDDTGTTNIGTLWFAWIPGQDYLPLQPTSTTSPTGWAVDQFTHAGSSDGYAIQWVASSDLLTPGNSLTFSFDTTAPPAQIAADSTFHPGVPVTTAFIYSGAPFSDNGVRLVATVVTPEPSSLALLFLGATGVVVAVWHRRKLPFAA